MLCLQKVLVETTTTWFTLFWIKSEQKGRGHLINNFSHFTYFALSILTKRGAGENRKDCEKFQANQILLLGDPLLSSFELLKTSFMTLISNIRLVYTAKHMIRCMHKFEKCHMGIQYVYKLHKAKCAI